MRTLLVRFGVMSVAFAGLVAGESAWSQSYPIKPVRLIVAGPAAGGADVIVRPIAQKLSESLGQQFIVDNRPGAGTIISGQIAASSPPDGYTLLLATLSNVTGPYLVKKLPYDPVQDFTPVTLVATSGLMVTVHPGLPVKTIRDLIGLAKARPKQLLYASNGKGSFSHLTTELLSREAGITMVHVPYKGGSPAVIDTVAGQTQLVITAIPTLIAQVRASRLRALAVTGGQRSTALPELPTVAESGLPDFESTQWFAVLAPKNTPASIVEKLYGEIRRAADNPAVKASLSQEGAELSVTGPQALAKRMVTDSAKWQKVIRESHLVVE